MSKVLKAEETESNLNDEEEDDIEHDEEDASDLTATAASNDDGIGNGSGGGADIDMADIVVIDEYDSTKPEVKKSKEVSKNYLYQKLRAKILFSLGRTKTTWRTRTASVRKTLSITRESASYCSCFKNS